MKHLFILYLLSFIIVSCGKVSNSNSGAVPSAASALTATLASSTKVNLSWTDNSTDESGFKIERKTGTGGYGLIGITASNVTTYIDTLVSNNTNYTYRVYSYNSTGNSSTYTNEASISITDTTAPQDTMATKIKNGLVAWYPFTGNANDSSVNTNNGVVSGAILTTDRFGNAGQAYSFDGLSSYILVANSSAINFGNGSINVWVKSSQSSKSCFMTKTKYADAQGENWGLGQNSTPSLFSFGVHYNSSCVPGAGWNDVFSNSTTADNQWHMVTAIIGDHYISIYRDSVLQGIVSTPNSAADICNGNLNIGRFWSGEPQYFQGVLDEIRIYNRVLTQSEITYLASH